MDPASQVRLALGAPWLEPLIAQLRMAHAAGRVASAQLIHDEAGAGGEAFAMLTAKLLLCEHAPDPCGACRSCRAFDNAQHPDFLLLGPTDESKYIRVEQIRDLSEQLALTSHGGRGTVALLAAADSMNAHAANALLKTLEEPRRGVTLLLVAASPSRLPATIRSRCQRLKIPAPNREECIQWLQREAGPGPWAAVLDVLGSAPFSALGADAAGVARLKSETDRSLEDGASGRLDVPGTAERWGRGESLDLRLACVAAWLVGRIERAARTRGADAVRAGAPGLNLTQSLRLLDGVYELQRLRASSVNRALALEQLLWQLPRASGVS